MTSCFDGNYRLRAPRRIKANAWRTIRLMSRCIARCQFTLDYPWVLSHRNSTPLKRRKTPSTLSAVPNICLNEQKEVMHHSFLLLLAFFDDVIESSSRDDNPISLISKVKRHTHTQCSPMNIISSRIVQRNESWPLSTNKS